MLIFTLCANSYAQEALPTEVEIGVDTFFEQLANEDVETAINNLVKGTLLESKVQELNLVIGQLKNLPLIYGPIVEVELLEVKYSTESLLRARYLVKLRDYPTVFDFYFYNMDGSWTLLKFWFNDTIEALF